MNKQEARKFLKNQAGIAWSAFQELTMEELRAAKKVASEYSTTNCWYAEFYMKEAFLKMIDGRIADLKTLQAEKKRTST